MFLHELAWGGVFISPMLIYALIALALTALSITVIHKSRFSRYIPQEAWLEIAIFATLLACVTGVAGTF